jgi:hypothetical protein
MHARDLDAGPPQQIVERDLQGLAHQTIDGERPVGRIEARNTQMAEHDHVVQTCHAIGKLVRPKRMTHVGTGRIEFRCSHGASFVPERLIPSETKTDVSGRKQSAL